MTIPHSHDRRRSHRINPKYAPGPPMTLGNMRATGLETRGLSKEDPRPKCCRARRCRGQLAPDQACLAYCPMARCSSRHQCLYPLHDDFLLGERGGKGSIKFPRPRLTAKFCGRPDQHPYELFLRTTRVKRPQSNGIVERLHRTLLDEHFRVEGQAQRPKPGGRVSAKIEEQPYAKQRAHGTSGGALGSN
jgi:hypothetical protein